jgi:hypothetical protein
MTTAHIDVGLLELWRTLRHQRAALGSHGTLRLGCLLTALTSAFPWPPHLSGLSHTVANAHERCSLGVPRCVK